MRAGYGGIRIQKIDFETFEKHISDIRRMDDLRQSLSVLSEESKLCIEFPALTDNVVELLEILANGTEDLIGRWIFEWDFGKTAPDSNLATIDGLWKALTSKQ